jgi:adenine-specific DNA methylase
VNKQHLLLAEGRKARGAFFTPPEICRFMSEWALRSPHDMVLEPSCGEAAFLLPIAKRMQQIGTAKKNLTSHLHGYDIHEDSLTNARQLLAENDFAASLHMGDFFANKPTPVFDAVIGNPPYVRYQNFTGEARMIALQAALRQGVRLNQLASSWAAFTVHASAFLKKDGRLALVLPGELLAVKYAAEVRRFLLNRFANVRLVLFENLVFPGVLEEVVLLLAEGSGGAQRFEVYQARDAEDLKAINPTSWTGFTPGNEKWTGALLPSQAFDLYGNTLASGKFEVLHDWGETYLGAVTGNNNFFTLTRAQIAKSRLAQNDLVRISPPGSRHLRGLTFSDHAWESMAKNGERCYMLAPQQNPSEFAKQFIAEGESQNVPKAYKCKVREPWWRVPLVERPDLLFTYMNHDRPRLIRNAAGVHLLNSLYGVKLQASRRKLGQEMLPLALLNSMTLLGAEIVGRSYGGGMLKLEPTEADRLPLPSFDILEQVASQLRLLQPQVGAMLRRNDITPVLDMVDQVVLKNHMKLSDNKIGALRDARNTLLHRRMTRGKGQHGKD